MSKNLTMTGTFSKHQRAWGLEDDLTVTVAVGAQVELSDGRRYIDWVSGLGTNLFGYGYFAIALANEVVNGGGSLSLPHRLEYEAADLLAQMLAENIPHWKEQSLGIRFALSGTDAVSMAVRLARAVTGRSGILVLKGGYHGWADWTIARTDPAAGVPPDLFQHIKEFKFNDIASLRHAAAVFDRQGTGIAAVVIEQGLEKPDEKFYPAIRKFCDQNGILLIMDEVVTGLRYGLGGVCGLYGIAPDLVCMGKSLGNGLPVAALVGGRALMGEFAKTSPVFCSSTNWGNSLNMAAAVAVLENWDKEKITQVWETGHNLMGGLRQAGWKIIGDAARSLVTFDSLEEQAFFIHGMRAEGVLMNRPNFPTLSHTTEMVGETVTAAHRVRAQYKAALERGVLQKKVAGRLPRVLFSDR